MGIVGSKSSSSSSSSGIIGSKKEAVASAPKGGSGLNIIGRTLQLLDQGRRGVAAVVKELDDLVPGTGRDRAKSDGFSLGDIPQNYRDNIGAGDLVDTGNKWADRGIGLAGDIAIDPLSYVTLGVGTAAKKAGRGIVGRVAPAEVARKAAKAGDVELANRILGTGVRGSLNRMTAEEAARYGIRQGPTIGLGQHRRAIPGGDVVARAASKATSPLTDRINKLPLHGIGNALKGATPLERQLARDADRARRLLAKGANQTAKREMSKILADNPDLDTKTLRDALEGVGAHPAAQPMRKVLDDYHTWAEEQLGRELPYLDDYLTHRFTKEAKDARTVVGPTFKAGKPGVLKQRGYRAGDTFYGETLQTGSISEMNDIYKAKVGAKHNLYEDNPVKIIHQWLDDMTTMVGRSPDSFATQAGAVEAPLKTVGAKGSRAAKKEAKSIEAALKQAADELDKARAAIKQGSRNADELAVEAARVEADAVAQELKVRTLAERADVSANLRPLVVEKAVLLDHAMIATDPEALVAQASDNLKSLDAQRVLRHKADQRMLALRQEADRLFSESARLRAAGDDELANVAALEAQARKIEADLPDLDAKFQKAMAKAGEERFVRDVESMVKRGLIELNDGRFAEPWVAEAAVQIQKSVTPANVGRLVKEFDRVSGFWRATALLSPGYHMRNAFGGLFNNMIADMDWKRYAQFRKIERQFNKGGLEAIDDPMLRNAAEAGQRLGQWHGTDISDVTKLAGMDEGGRIVGRQNPVFRANFKAAEQVEAHLRMPLFIDVYVKTGGNEQAALDAVMKYHFDYDDLSKMEREVGRRAFGFYTWSRNNLPLMMAEMADNPGVFNRYTHLKRNMELGIEEDEGKPGYFNKSLAIALPFKFSGGRVYAFPELPFIAANNVLGVNELASSLNPLIKTPIETFTNRKFFEQRSFSDTLRSTPKTWGPILHVLALNPGIPGLPRVHKSADGTLMMDEREANKIESLLPMLSRMRRLAPSEQKYQDRVLTSWLSFVGGISARTLDEATIGGEMQRRKTEAAKQAKRQAELAGGKKLDEFKAAERQAKAIKAAQEGRRGGNNDG